MDLTQTALLCGILVLAALVIYAQARDSARHPARLHGRISKDDKRFLRQAVTVSAAEITLSQLALKRSATALVQYMAKRIVDDCTQMNRKLASLAWRYRVNVSAEPGPEVQRKASQLRALGGSAFDHAYDAVIVQDHLKAIHLFSTAAHSSNPEIRGLAQETLPTLDLHLKMASELDPRVAATAAPPLPPM